MWCPMETQWAPEYSTDPFPGAMARALHSDYMRAYSRPLHMGGQHDPDILEGHDKSQSEFMAENCILVDADDCAIGSASKVDCHSGCLLYTSPSPRDS